MYMTSLLFDVIGRLCPKKRQNQNFLVSTDSPITRYIRDKIIAKLPDAMYLQRAFENLKLIVYEVNKGTLRLRV